MTDDTPTQRLPETTDAAGELVEERQKSKALLFTLVGVGAALLIAIIVLLIILFGGGKATPDSTPTPSDSPTVSPTPSESPTPSPTPTPTPTPDSAPPPPSNTTKINSFSVSNTTVLCNTQSPNPSSQYISFSWDTSNADTVYFGVNTNDASQGAFFDNLPQDGNSQNDFPAGYNDFEYPCPSEQTKYTLTVVGPGGAKVSKSVTVTNEGDTQ
jgi:hypothetical protein